MRSVISNYQQLEAYNPRIAVIEDDSPAAGRKIADLIKKSGGRPMVIPRQLSDRLLASQKLTRQQIQQIRKAATADEVREFSQQIATATRLHLQYIVRKLTFVDAVILPGSVYDIPPSAYHDTTVHAKTRLAPPIDVRFHTELVMADYALHTRKIPLLGISSGMQLIVVKTGGKLVQHLPDYDKFEEQVMQNVRVTSVSANGAGLLLEKMAGKERELVGKLGPSLQMTQTKSILGVMLDGETFDNINEKRLGLLHVNHQGVRPEDVNQSELRITATTDDGQYVEAVEHAHHPFCLGVQFHPEYSEDLGLKMIREMVDYSKQIKAQQFDTSNKLAFYVDQDRAPVYASAMPGAPTERVELRLQ